MNKIAVVHDNLYGCIYYETNKLVLFKRDIDCILFDVYGLVCIVNKSYRITDESKFSLFMLKYPEHIRNVSYE